MKKSTDLEVALKLEEIEREESKQEYESECICNAKCKGFTNVKCKKPTQETLEEAAERYANDNHDSYSLNIAFEYGAKWQQERMYVEADKIMKFLDTEVELKLSDTKTIERIKWYLETFFEQFKKK